MAHTPSRSFCGSHLLDLCLSLDKGNRGNWDWEEAKQSSHCAVSRELRHSGDIWPAQWGRTWPSCRAGHCSAAGAQRAEFAWGGRDMGLGGAWGYEPQVAEAINKRSLKTFVACGPGCPRAGTLAAEYSIQGAVGWAGGLQGRRL